MTTYVFNLGPDLQAVKLLGVPPRSEFPAMWNMLRYYWIAARGYRLCPWKSPYLQWRFETFLGKEAADLDAKKFFRLSWKYRDQLARFSDWAATRRRAMHPRA